MHAEGVDTTHRSESLRTAIADAITILAAALNGSVAFEDVEKAVFELMEEHPPTLMLSEVEVKLCDTVWTIVLAGNATLKAEMTAINPRAVGELPESLVDVTSHARCRPPPRRNQKAPCRCRQTSNGIRE